MPRFASLSFDDGVPTDKVLAEVLRALGIPATFYISLDSLQFWRTTDAALVEVYRGHEIGAHSMTHVPLNTLNRQDMETEVGKSKSELERIFGQTVDCFAYPWGLHTPDVQRVVRDAGFSWARGTVRTGTNISNPFAIATDGTFDAHFPTGAKGNFCHYFGHSWLIHKNYGNYDRIRTLCEAMIAEHWTFIPNSKFFEEAKKTCAAS